MTKIKELKRLIAIILVVTLLPVNEYSIIAASQKEIGESTQITEEQVEKDQLLESSNITDIIQGESEKSYPDLTVTENYVLQENLEVNDLVHKSGTLDLNGHTLKINGNYLGENGVLNINGGELYCLNDLKLSDRQRLIMTNVNDYLYVEKNVEMALNTHNGADITEGIMEICGDVSITSKTFQITGYNKIILSGKDLQTLNLDTSVYLNTVEIKNYSREGIYSATPFNCKEFIRNNCVITIGDEEGNYGYTLEKDMEIDGDYILVADTLNLNGHKLTVNGDFIQPGGVVWINGGELIINGDYRIQSRIKKDEKLQYGMSAGILNMTKETDRVIVDGNFITSSACKCKDMLTAGILEVRKDFTIDTKYSENNFLTSGRHQVLLSGEQSQKINCGVCRTGNSGIANLDISNSSEEGIIFETPTVVSGHINDRENIVKGYLVPVSTTTYENDTFHGDLYFKNYGKQSGTCNIIGDVHVMSYIEVEGTMNIQGSYYQQDGGY
ncbi:MAG: hypothetical protein IIT65_00040, partial [Lachnospiraceae bacterium]|nr:hypothetical protein [Lachnospiraceae bacterium]